MKKKDSGQTSNDPLLNSPKSTKDFITPAAPPFSKSVFNKLSPIQLLSSPRPYNQTQLLSPFNLGESLNLSSPVLQEKQSSFKYLQRLDFSSISSSVNLKINSVPTKITVTQERSNSPVTRPVKKVKKDILDTNKVCCNFQNSKCLKLNCECFAEGVICEGCDCKDCLNSQSSEIERRDEMIYTLDRNATALKSKIKTVNLKEEPFEIHNKGSKTLLG